MKDECLRIFLASFTELAPSVRLRSLVTGAFIRLSKKARPPHSVAASAAILPATGDADADVMMMTNSIGSCIPTSAREESHHE